MEKKTIIAGGGLVLNNQQELLMIFRRGKWDLPKGKQDPGETIEDCAVREIKEETGLQEVILGRKLSITHHTYFDTYLQEEVIKETHWFLMQAPGNQTLVPQTEEDITEIKWMAAKEREACLANSYDTIVSVIREWESA
jgi:8-oxo-dGTP pyrophosphatase MutT (NUDIX family)